MSVMVEVPNEVVDPLDRGFKMEFTPNNSMGVVIISIRTGEGEYTLYERWDMSRQNFDRIVRLLKGKGPVMQDHGAGRVSATFPETEEYAMRQVEAELPSVTSPETMDDVCLTPLPE